MRLEMTLLLVALLSLLSLAATSEEKHGIGISLSSGYG
jgi:hypothetical protein